MQALNYAGNIANQVFILYLLISVGAIFGKFKFINQSGAKQLTDVVFYAATPMVIIKAFQEVEFTKSSAARLAIAAGCAFLTHIIGIVIGRFLFKKNTELQRNVLRCSVIFSNCGFMSLPLTAAVLGSEGVFLVSIYIGVNNIFFWTVGYGLFNKGGISVKKAVLNPGVIGVFIALPLFFFSIKLPNMVSAPIGHLAALNTPLAMIITGYHLVNASLKPEKGDFSMYTAMFCRMLAVPLLSLAIFRLLGISGDTLTACMIPASAPVAAGIMMFASKFDSDTRLASKIVSISTLFAIITMPIILTLCNI